MYATWRASGSYAPNMLRLGRHQGGQLKQDKEAKHSAKPWDTVWRLTESKLLRTRSVFRVKSFDILFVRGGMDAKIRQPAGNESRTFANVGQKRQLWFTLNPSYLRDFLHKLKYEFVVFSSWLPGMVSNHD